MTTALVFWDLTRNECERLVARNHVGRVGFAVAGRVSITPIHYVYANGWIFCRTAHGAKIEAITHHPWVTFEVDECPGIFDWRSVQVLGAVEVLRTEPTEAELHGFEPGVTLLRAFLPETLRGDDPVPFRHVLFRIHLDEVTGRGARPS